MVGKPKFKRIEGGNAYPQHGLEIKGAIVCR